MNRKERQEQRATHYKTLAEKARQESHAAFQKSNDAVAGIVPGQPILVGHHSEGRHRRALERSWGALGKGVKLEEKAEYYEEKAEAAASNDAIYSGDDDAVERLRAKIKNLEETQERMKTVNKIIRNKKLTQAEKLEQIEALGIEVPDAEKLLVPGFTGFVGFAPFELSNNNAVLHNARKRLRWVEAIKNRPVTVYMVGEIKVVENTPENRLQLYFNGVPEKEVRSLLKAKGFRWAPTLQCWQAYFHLYTVRWVKEKFGINEPTE